MLSSYIRDKEWVLLPFSAKVHTLDYQIDVDTIQPHDFDSLAVVTKDLRFKIIVHDGCTNEDLVSLLVSFLNQIAVLGHFERLSLSIFYWEKGEVDEIEPKVIAPVADALIAAIVANPELSYLDLSDNPWLVNWHPFLPNIFKALEEHSGLRTFVVRDCPPEYNSDENYSEVDEAEDEEYVWPFRFDYSLLTRLLSRNRHIAVYDIAGNYFSNGRFIDNLCLLNPFYCGSAKLVTESSSWRPLLVATALMENASEDVQFISLLLSNHVDVLCEFIQVLHEEDDSADTQSVPEASESLGTIPPKLNRAGSSKRKARIQPSRAAKKTARK